ncbi:hypothetical protein IKX64_00165 [Candidatus Saccharibacteria bacterium]|nr:hypothetical protein [Candidatus Saccharibacteria bacterium]
MDFSSLLNEAVKASGVSTFNAAQSWQICTIIISALGALALFAFFTYFKKGAEKRKVGEDLKNFFLFKGNWAEDLARLVFYYVSISYAMSALQTLTTGGDPWGFFEGVFYLVFIRFVYEAAVTIIRFCKGDKK